MYSQSWVQYYTVDPATSQARWERFQLRTWNRCHANHLNTTKYLSHMQHFAVTVLEPGVPADYSYVRVARLTILMSGLPGWLFLCQGCLADYPFVRVVRLAIFVPGLSGWLSLCQGCQAGYPFVRVVRLTVLVPGLSGWQSLCQGCQADYPCATGTGTNNNIPCVLFSFNLGLCPLFPQVKCT